jgi:hypothetical protein
VPIFADRECYVVSVTDPAVFSAFETEEKIEEEITLRYCTQRGARIVLSVQQPPAGAIINGSEFQSRQGQEFSFVHVVYTHSEAYQSSFDLLHREQRVRGVKMIKSLTCN